MLKKFLKRNFANKIFTWGRNLNNCGYEVNNVTDGVMPRQLQQLDLDVQKFVSGYAESFILTKDGKLYQFGHNTLLPSSKLVPSQFQTSEKVIDADLDSSNAAVLLQSGKVQLLNTSSKLNTQIQIDNARMICCGKDFYVAVVNENNQDKVVMWGNKNFSRDLYIFGNKIPKNYVQQIDSVNDVIAQEKSNIKKLQVADNSIGMLLENGSFYTWGHNQTGNLGLKRSMCAGEDELTNSNPKKPLSLIKNNDKVIDFALSSNMLVVLTENNEAFWCGLDKKFNLEKIQTLENKKVNKIGAFFNNFIIVTEDNKTYAREALPEEEYPIYHGNQKLYEYNRDYFGKADVQQIGGKYENVIMMI